LAMAQQDHLSAIQRRALGSKGRVSFVIVRGRAYLCCVTEGVTWARAAFPSIWCCLG